MFVTWLLLNELTLVVYYILVEDDNTRPRLYVELESTAPYLIIQAEHCSLPKIEK